MFLFTDLRAEEVPVYEPLEELTEFDVSNNTNHQPSIYEEDLYWTDDFLKTWDDCGITEESCRPQSPLRNTDHVVQTHTTICECSKNIEQLTALISGLADELRRQEILNNKRAIELNNHISIIHKSCVDHARNSSSIVNLFHSLSRVLQLKTPSLLPIPGCSGTSK